MSESTRFSTKVEFMAGAENDFKELHDAIKDGKAGQNEFINDSSESSDNENLTNKNIQKSAADQDPASSSEEDETEPNPDQPGPRFLWAAQNDDRIEILKEILSKNSNVIKFADEDGYTALHRAAYSGSKESLIILLKAGADINVVTEDGWTPLHSACRWNRAACVEILLNWGSNVNKPTVGNQTPLHLAAVCPNSSKTLQLLMLHPDIKPMIKNCQEDTPLDIAKRNSNAVEVFDLALPFFSCRNTYRTAINMATGHGADDPLADDLISLGESEDISEKDSSMAKDTNCYMRDTIMGLHRSSMSSNEDIRQASICSLVELAKQEPESADLNLGLIVLQTWLEQFARTNGGSSPTEYCAPDRVRLLQSLMTITDHMSHQTNSNAFRAAISRAVSLATEEMTRQNDIVDEIQLPCSKILVRFGSRIYNVQKVMDSLLIKFQPGSPSHFYVIATLSDLATCNPTHIVPYLKAILGTMLANIKTTKKDNLRYAYANAFSRFSEAILDYLANIDNTPDPSVTKEHFVSEIDAAHEVLFSIWMNGKGMSLTNSSHFDVQKVKNVVIEALGYMGPLLSDERLYKNTASPVCSTLLGMYKKMAEPFYITQCVSNLLKAMIERDLQIIDGIIEPLFTALFVQVCQFSAVSSENVDNFKRKNHYEVLRCYDLLIRSHPEKLISGLLIRLNSVDENIRVSSLIIFRHLMNSSLEVIQTKMSDIFNALHSRLNEVSNRVRKMLAQLTALLGSLGYLEGPKGRDFLEFIVGLCALPSCDQSSLTSNDILTYLTSDMSNYSVVTNSTLKEMCDNILMLMTKKEAMEAILWPFLIDFLLAPEYMNAVPSVIKSLSQLAFKMRQSTKTHPIEYSQFKHVYGPYVLFSRVLVLAAVPPNNMALDGLYVLAFMQNFAPHINKHLSGLWDQRIPLLQHYLEQTKVNIDQAQWEEWLLTLMDDTLGEIDLDEWNTALITAMTQQLTGLYSGTEQAKEKIFLMKAMGRALKVTKSGNHRTLILDTLTLIFNSTVHSETDQQGACAIAFGYASESHLTLVLEKLEALLKAEFSKKRGISASTFFGFMRDSKLEEGQLQIRCTILRCLGASTKSADLKTKADEMCQKFIMPAMQSASSSLKMAALKAVSDIARALQQFEDFSLVHHQDLIHEAIECMKAKSWPLNEKHVALLTTLELVKLPPYVSQLTRCSILKACFTAVFPSLIRVQQQNQLVPNKLITSTSSLHMPSLVQEQEYSSSISPLSSGQCTPTLDGSSSQSSHLKPILDKLLNLVQSLLLQELKQSTLDEIFTLLEPYLKLPEKLAREMAITILHATLKTFLENRFPLENHLLNESSSSSDSTTISTTLAFSPGPYIMGSLVPRCFDGSKLVQSNSLACLQLLVKIGNQYQSHVNNGGMSEESVEALLGLERISASCSPMTMSTFATLSANLELLESSGVSPSLVCKTITQVLRLELTKEEVLPLLHSLIDGLTDEVVTSAKGASLVLCSLLETRGFEEDVAGQATILVSKLHGKLLVLEAGDETRERALMAVRLLASHNALTVIDSLLNDHPLPFDEALVNIWRTLTKDKTLAEFLLQHLISLLKKPSELILESYDKLTSKTSKAASHTPLASLLALKICFDMKEMEAVVESEFAEVFVPLVMGLATYQDICVVQKAKKDWKPCDLKPFEVTTDCLQAFLYCKGCRSMASLVPKASSEDPREFSDFVALLTEGLCADFPMYLHRVAMTFKAFDSIHDLHFVTMASFFSQLLLTDSIIEISLLGQAIEMLLTALYQHQGHLLRVVCVNGLSGYKLDTLSKAAELKDHAPAILEAVMITIGDDLDSDVNYHGLVTLTKLMIALPIEIVTQRVTEIVSKISTFFDSGKQIKDRAASMLAFGQLAALMTSRIDNNSNDSDNILQKDQEDLDLVSLSHINASRDLFSELVHQVMVSLLLHLNDDHLDERVETREASRQTLSKVLAFYSKTSAFKNVIQTHLGTDQSQTRLLNYMEFLKDFSRITYDPVTEMFPSYIEKAMTYFHIGDARIRANAVHLITALLVEGSHSTANYGHTNAETIGNALVKLLNDGNSEVQISAASNIGKVCIAISQPSSQPRLSLNLQSEEDYSASSPPS